MIEYWENQQIDFTIFRNEKLLNPGESFGWTLKKLNDQKESYEKEILESQDLGLLKADFKTLRKQIISFPSEIIKKFSLFMPEMIRLRNVEVKDWYIYIFISWIIQLKMNLIIFCVWNKRMNNAANLFKGGGANIDEFVKKSNHLKVV